MKTRRIYISLVCASLIGGCIGTDFIDENPAGDPVLAITPGSGAVIIDQSVQFEGEYRDSFDMLVESPGIQWTSSDNTVASIDVNGTATGHLVGQTMILGEVDGIISNTAILNVVADATKIARVEISMSSLLLPEGDSQTLTATAYNVLDEVLPSPGTTWISTDPSVATVDQTGLVTAVATGVTEVTATIDGVDSAPTAVTVPGRTKEGSFSPAPGSSYTVAGTGRLVESATGRLTIEFDSDFAVSDGPDIQVYVSSTSNVTSSSTNLGLVKKRSGAQQYSILGSVEFESINYIIIHCVSFNVTFGQAEIR